MHRAVLLVLPVMLAAMTGQAREARLRMPDGMPEAVDTLTVSGHSPRRHGEPVRIGPYSALELREGDRFGWEIPLGRPALRGLDTGWAFTQIAIGQAPVQVQCRARARALVHGDADATLSVDLDMLRTRPVLVCAFRSDGEERHVLELFRRGERLEGTASGPDGAYRVASLHGLEGTPLPSGTPAGYQVREDGRTVMVVDRLNAGAVSLDSGLSPAQRVPLAALATALLMFDPAFGDD